jgi:hypothetical protein
MAFQLTIGTLGAIITEANFPASLRAGEKITGTLKIRTPFNEKARVLIEAWTLWNNYYFAALREVGVSEEATLNFPADFVMREPATAPDPTMPVADAAIYFVATALSETGKQQTETLTVVIRLQTQITVAGIPIWLPLLLIPLAGIGGYILYKKYRKRL